MWKEIETKRTNRNKKKIPKDFLYYLPYNFSKKSWGWIKVVDDFKVVLGRGDS